MKRTAIIFLLAIFSVLFANRTETSVSREKPNEEFIQNSFEDLSRMNLDTMADILQDCRFEMPQATRLNLKRNDVQPSLRRLPLNIRTVWNSLNNQPQRICPDTSKESQEAIAASRHERGYYIYSLRHIII